LQNGDNMRDFSDILKGLSKSELKELVTQAESRMNEIRDITLRVIVKGAYDYVYATWYEHGVTQQKSLGRWYGQGELKALADSPKPREVDYRISEAKGKAMQDSENWQGVSYWNLDDDEFLEVHGCKPHEDMLGRPRKLWFNRQKWQADLKKWESQKRLWTENKWSRAGVGTEKGLTWLKRMESEGNNIIG